MDIDYALFGNDFSIVCESREDALLTVPALLLLDSDQMKSLLTVYQEQIKGLDLQVAAAYFASSWRGVCTALQYMISLTESRLDLSLANLTIQICEVKGKSRVLYVLNQQEELPWPEEQRTVWREVELGTFYRDTLRPVFERVSQVSGLVLSQLWGQLPLGVSFYMESIRSRLGDEAQLQRLEEDYQFLVTQLSPDYFGLKRNPYRIKEVWLDDPHKPGQKKRMKPTCCLAYRIESGNGKCFTCPKLSAEEREAKRLEIVTAAAAQS